MHLHSVQKNEQEIYTIRKLCLSTVFLGQGFGAVLIKAAGGLRQLGYRFPEPQGAFYLLLKAPEGDGRAFSRRCMAEDVLVVPGEEFFCPGYVRLAYCVPEERLRRALPAFRKITESYGILP